MPLACVGAVQLLASSTLSRESLLRHFSWMPVGRNVTYTPLALQFDQLLSCSSTAAFILTVTAPWNQSGFGRLKQWCTKREMEPKNFKQISWLSVSVLWSSCQEVDNWYGSSLNKICPVAVPRRAIIGVINQKAKTGLYFKHFWQRLWSQSAIESGVCCLHVSQTWWY